MAEKRPTPRSTIIVAGVVFGGLMAVVIGQKFSKWALESQTNSIIIVVAGAIAGGVIAWIATRARAGSQGG